MTMTMKQFNVCRRQKATTLPKLNINKQEKINQFTLRMQSENKKKQIKQQQHKQQPLQQQMILNKDMQYRLRKRFQF